MAWDTKEKGTPFERTLGPALPDGRGKDSVVQELKTDKKGVYDQKIVVKTNHIKQREHPTVSEVESKAQYLQNKYQILKAFLGDSIPNTQIVVGKMPHGNRMKTHTLTLQERKPQIKISQLTAEQKRDPRLTRNLHAMLTKILQMHEVVRAVNKLVPPEARVDVRLDLGTVSRIIKRQTDLQNMGTESIPVDFFDSPNILIDPSTMKPYCVDFGAGTWSSAKEATKLLILSHARSKSLIAA